MSDKAMIKKFAKALDTIVETGEEIMADGKVSFDDAPSAMKVAPAAKDLYDVWNSKDQLVEELKQHVQGKIDELVE